MRMCRMSGLSVLPCEPAVSKNTSAVFRCMQQHWQALCVSPGITLPKTLQHRMWSLLSSKSDSKKWTTVALSTTVTWYCSIYSKKKFSSNLKDHRFRLKFILTSSTYSKENHLFSAEGTRSFQTLGGLFPPRDFSYLWVTGTCPFSLAQVNSPCHYLLPLGKTNQLHLLPLKHQKAGRCCYSHASCRYCTHMLSRHLSPHSFWLFLVA